MKHHFKVLQLIIGVVTCMIIIMISNMDSNAQSFKVERVGKGKQSVILIPGLTCPGDVWKETVEELKEVYTFHILTLPGFANQPPVERNPYLQSMRDEIIQYIKTNKLKEVILLGHSLGGFLSLWIGASQPELIGKIVIVDSLPFLAAAQNASATPESARPMAEGMRKMMASATPEQVKQNQKYYLPGMINNPEKAELISQWGIQAHQPTVAQAMYELQTTDLRETIATIEAPVLVLGAWIAYQQYGATKESTYKIFESQYTKLSNKEIILSDVGKHFLMFDDPQWFYDNINKFLTQPKF